MALSKRDKLTEFNRSNILGAAKKLFETNGVYETTVDDIARAADYSKSTIYVYFKSKDEIYYTIIHESMAELKERLKGVQKDGFEDTYYSVCRMLAEFQRGHPLYFEGMSRQISVDEEDFERCPVLRDIYETGEEMNGIMAAMVARGMESGYLRQELKPVPTILTLWASLCGVIRMAEQKEAYFSNKLKISKQEYLDYSFKMLLNSIKAGERE